MIATFTLNAAIDRTVRISTLCRGDLNRAVVVSVRAGGKGINVASISHALGAEAVASGFVGGHAGRFIETDVRRMGVRAEFVEIDGESRVCLAIIEDSSGTVTEITENGPRVDECSIDKLEAKVRSLASAARVCVFSGSLPPGCPDDLYGRLVYAAKRQECFAVLDTSGVPLRCGLSGEPDLIKPNKKELEDLVGCDLPSFGDVADAAKQVSRAYEIPYVVVTLGPDGAFAVTPEGDSRIAVPEVPVRNTVGCGDAFVAGMCVAIERGRGAEDVLAHGAAAACAKLSCDDAGTCDPGEALRLIDHVAVVPWRG